MIRIGLTGGMGSGKSEAAERMRELGAHVLEADRIAREIVEPGSPALGRLVDAFGSRVLREDGTLDRAGLAAVAFASEEALRKLNEATWPELTSEIIRRAEEIEREHPDGVLVVDAALLVRWDLLDLFDVVLLVTAPQETRIERLVATGRPEADVRARVASQLPEEELEGAADAVIRNTGTVSDLRSAVDDFWHSFVETRKEKGNE